MSKIEEEKTVLELNAGILVERESGSTSPHRRNHGKPWQLVCVRASNIENSDSWLVLQQ